MTHDLGCWKTNVDNPVLDSIDGFERDFKPKASSIQKCAALAQKNGWSIFGVQGDWFCGSASDADVKYKKYGESNTCLSSGVGGEDSIQIYEIDIVVDGGYWQKSLIL